jgi:multicomponent K+:H+ antiporter subunit A
MSLALLVALPFAGSLVATLLPTHARTAAAIWAGLVSLAGTVATLALYPSVREGAILHRSIAWMPEAGLTLSIRIDGFAWMFALLVTAIGLLVAVYARYYMSQADPVPRFYAFFLAFMGSMLGLVTAGNLIQLAFFWELTSVFSFLLIGYWHHRREARRGALTALVVTATGGLCLLGGVLVIGHVVGSYELDAVLHSGDRIRSDPLYPWILALVLLAAFTKSAQFPFQFWLPQAMAAPTPVSAYLHSATMVKAGVFLLARLWPVLAGTPTWFFVVGGVGLFTMLLGAWAAMFQRDLKGLLAYSTVSHLGLITLLLGLDSPLASVAAVFHMMNHATFKASAFMAAGVIDHETGTRDLGKLHGLFRAMPITGTLAIVASAAMAGVPLLNGFLSKEMFFAETVYISSLPWVERGLPVAATVFGAFAVVYALRFGYGVFFGAPPADLPREPHEPVRWMRVPIELLVLACVVVGVFPAQSVGVALAVAAAPVVGGNLPGYSLALWHGFTPPLMMSLVAMGGGAAIYAWLRRQLQGGRLRRLRQPLVADGQRVFEAVLAFVSMLARHGLRLLATRRLQPQMFWMLLLCVLAGTAAMGQGGLAWGTRPRIEAGVGFAVLWSIGVLCALSAAWQAKFHRLAALVLVAVTGLLVALTFALFSAPDLALTQLVVESATTVLFLLGLRWLPRRVADAGARSTTLRARARRLRHFLLAVASGTGLAVLSYALLTRPAPQSISPFFLAKALPEGGGANVVNVMLVDFRSFDTLGEITVLGVVGLTVFALLRRFRPPRETAAVPRQKSAAARPHSDLLRPRETTDATLGYLVVPAVLAGLVLPLAVLVAAYLFMRGHNAPGGGFVAGLVVALAILVQYLVAGAQWVEAHLTLNPARWIATGLLLALATGLGAVALGFPFLTTHTAHLTLPLLGEVHVPSALFFDLGVFATVVGATLLILLALAHQSVRARRYAAQREREAAEAAEAPAATSGTPAVAA